MQCTGSSIASQLRASGSWAGDGSHHSTAPLMLLDELVLAQRQFHRISILEVLRLCSLSAMEQGMIRNEAIKAPLHVLREVIVCGTAVGKLDSRYQCIGLPSALDLLTSVAPPIPAGGRICASKSEWPALRALKDESTWKSSLAYRKLTEGSQRRIGEPSHLIADHLRRAQRRNIT